MTAPDPDRSAVPADPSGDGVPERARRSRRREAVAAVLAGALLAAGTAVWLTAPADPPAEPRAAARRVPVAVPVVRLLGVRAGTMPWDRHLSVSATGGRLGTVRATGPAGQAVPGVRVGGRSWHSDTTLLPDARYALAVEVVDAAGRSRTVPLAVRTSAATRTLHARLSPGDGALVGVGTPVVLTLDRPVHSPRARAAVVRRLSVTASPPVRGAWHWVDDREVHFRGPTFWAAGSVVRVRADLTHLLLPGVVWGEGVRTTSYRVADAVVSTVDISAHSMTVRRNGTVIRVMRASMGRAGYPTRGGTHIVLEKQAERIMDSTTVGHPAGTPDYYREVVKDTVRITYSGTFVHSAPWSVKDQGVRNVSHGCVNLAPADAQWFFRLARRGDVVRVVHAVAGPAASDPGSVDWNSRFAAWARDGRRA